MGSIAVNKIKTEKSFPNIKTFLKKVAGLSFDADAVYESKDWPYLWPKTNPVQTIDRVLPTEEERVERKARRKRVMRISCWGIVSLAMYLGIFLNQGTITEYFTQGGYFALAVVGTALAFALVHGTFASYVLENLNFRAANRSKDDH
jgi:hypothetical protein